LSVDQLNQILLQNLVPILAAMGVLILVLLFWAARNSVKLSRTARFYRNLLRGMEDQNLEELLAENVRMVRLAQDKVKETDLACKKLEMSMKNCLQNLALVRFNAFDNVGSDLSYAIAILDQQGDGLVLSGLYGRDDGRTYAKPIKGGQSTYLLSLEEKEAIQQAMRGGKS
jgi:hypothetical protein